MPLMSAFNHYTSFITGAAIVAAVLLERKTSILPMLLPKLRVQSAHLRTTSKISV